MHNLHNLHKSFVLNAQRAAQVVFILFQTDTAVHRGKFMDTDQGCLIHYEPSPVLSQPSCEQA
jgi:hypothetical protein